MPFGSSTDYLRRTGAAGRLVAAFAFLMVAFLGTAQAAPLNIVVIGASIAAGKGVEHGEAWPGLLADLLRAQGYDVHMTVDVVLGRTSAEYLKRVEPTVVAGTQVVIFDVPIDNNRRVGLAKGEQQATVAETANRIRARGAVPVIMHYNMDEFPTSVRVDGVHLNAAAHKKVAAQLLPKVIAALGERP